MSRRTRGRRATPEYFPVAVATVVAMLDERFNLNGLQAATNPATPLAIITGPIVEELEIDSSTAVFGLATARTIEG